MTGRLISTNARHIFSLLLLFSADSFPRPPFPFRGALQLCVSMCFRRCESHDPLTMQESRRGFFFPLISFLLFCGHTALRFLLLLRVRTRAGPQSRFSVDEMAMDADLTISPLPTVPTASRFVLPGFSPSPYDIFPARSLLRMSPPLFGSEIRKVSFFDARSFEWV